MDLNSATELIHAMRNNKIEAATLTIDEALLLIESNIELYIIALLDFSKGGDVVLGKTEIKLLNQLKGKRIAVDKYQNSINTLLNVFFKAVNYLKENHQDAAMRMASRRDLTNGLLLSELEENVILFKENPSQLDKSAHTLFKAMLDENLINRSVNLDSVYNPLWFSGYL